MLMAGKVKKLHRFLTDRDYRFLVSAGRGWKANLPAEGFLKRMYRICMGKELNLEDPQTYTEKLQWLKLYDHRPEYTVMVDKYEAKQYVAEALAEEPGLSVEDVILTQSGEHAALTAELLYGGERLSVTMNLRM